MGNLKLPQPRQSLRIPKVPVVDDVTVVLPLGQVTVTAQAELLILFVFSAVALELELLSAEVILIFSVFVMVHHVSVGRYIKC
jgi:hypothetical protein